ncbi:hypothetical protein BH23BAC3_BH23BAC3_11430 [soil metagenome]
MKINNKTYLCIGLPVILLVFSGSWISGCGTGAEDIECPDTSFSQTNLDTLEAKNPKFIWRVCNENDEFEMNELIVEKYSLDSTSTLSLGSLQPCTCTTYYVGPYGGEEPINLVRYEQGEEEYHFVYLASMAANEGLTDSSLIQDTPGRYSYHFIFEKDATKPPLMWTQVKIVREVYN